MPQTNAWEKEYKNSQLLHFHPEPQKDTLRFLKYLKKEHDFRLDGKTVLDLGSGTGRNANHMASLGAAATGIEISPTAILIAEEAAREKGVRVKYIRQSMGESYPFPDASFDLIIDVVSSNSLTEKERGTYLEEASRVLKPGGFMFVKALALDGDKNAKTLLQDSPGPEKDTYIMKELGLTERVFRREDLLSLYGKYFTVLDLEKKESYPCMNGKSYKRQFWLLALQKT